MASSKNNLITTMNQRRITLTYRMKKELAFQLRYLILYKSTEQDFEEALKSGVKWVTKCLLLSGVAGANFFVV